MNKNRRLSMKMLRQKKYHIVVRDCRDKDDIITDKDVFTDSVDEIITIIHRNIECLLRDEKLIYINDVELTPRMLRETKFDIDNNTISDIRPFDYEH